tara:strand:- start:1393 stop:1563 length:171 start_codon:yes stop_codon:yes gene_type:complete
MPISPLVAATTTWKGRTVDASLAIVNSLLGEVEKDEEKYNTRPRWEGVYVGALKSE